MNKTLLNLAAIAGLGLSVPGYAHEAPGSANEAVVGDSTGHCVTDGSGVNVRTSGYTDEKGAEACAPEAVAVVEPAPVPTPVSETMTLSAAALFEFDSAKFVRDQPQLNEFADRVKGLTTVESVSVVGHTDSVGTDAYNQGLSERRADAVKTYLVERGVDGNIISASGMGESQPVADNATKEGRAENRRVEVTFKGTETK
jgi:OOP family OmpA-OmpF porin